MVPAVLAQFLVADSIVVELGVAGPVLVVAAGGHLGVEPVQDCCEGTFTYDVQS